MYFSARTEGRISYGHLGRTDSCCILEYSTKPVVGNVSNVQFQEKKSNVFTALHICTPYTALWETTNWALPRRLDGDRLLINIWHQTWLSAIIRIFCGHISIKIPGPINFGPIKSIKSNPIKSIRYGALSPPRSTNFLHGSNCYAYQCTGIPNVMAW